MYRVYVAAAFVSFCVLVVAALAVAAFFVGKMLCVWSEDRRRQKRCMEYLAKVYRAPKKDDGR